MKKQKQSAYEIADAIIRTAVLHADGIGLCMKAAYFVALLAAVIYCFAEMLIG